MMLTMEGLQALWLSIQLACLTVIILMAFGLPLMWKLSQYQGMARPFIESLIALPLVLPPTVIGFYLLIAFSPNAWLGDTWVSVFGKPFAFSFSGILIGSILYSLPFVFQPLLLAFERDGKDMMRTIQSHGITRTRAWLSYLLPHIRVPMIVAATMGFAHTLGEFGVILMIGGNIPQQTQVVSIALYNHVESLEYANAHGLALTLLIISVVLLTSLYWLTRRSKRGVNIFAWRRSS